LGGLKAGVAVQIAVGTFKCKQFQIVFRSRQFCAFIVVIEAIFLLEFYKPGWPTGDVRFSVCLRTAKKKYYTLFDLFRPIKLSCNKQQQQNHGREASTQATD
jgi:hypothetical protein